MKNFKTFQVLLVVVMLLSCSTTKKKSEVKGFKKFYHNTTAKFNGYFNAEELIDEGIYKLQQMHVDNYNSILEVYDYVAVDDASTISADMDKAIEKLSTVATIHDVSNYLDDCYVNIGKAQYLKQDYISAEETFQYFEEEFDPKNPYGRVYKVNNKKKTGNALKKERARERKEKEKERDEERKEKEKEREEAKKEREKTIEEKKKARKEELKQRKKDRKKKSSSKKKRMTKEERKAELAKRRAEKEAEEKLKETKSAEEIAAQKAKEEANKKAIEEAQRQKEEAEKKKKEKEKEEEKKYAREGEGAIFKNKTAYTEGLYWLARTYIETERYSTADYIIKRLEGTAGLTESVGKKLPAAKAHMYIKTKDFPLALVELDEAISQEKKKKNKARYAFIKAQIHERLGNISGAYEEYRRVKKFNPSYELELNAQLNEIKLAHKQGQKSSESVIKSMEKLLESTKNKDYQDQIHFALAQVRLESGDTEGAIADFNSALQSTGGNRSVKLEAYYKLANLLFDSGKYAESKEKFDEVKKLMSKHDDRYRSVDVLSKNLTQISNNMETIELQDSLLRLSLMSEEELREIAVEILDEKEANKEPLKAGREPNLSNMRRSNEAFGATKSDFFAYDNSQVNKGKIEFDRLWGDRVLEDNWRRSLRSDASSLFIDESEDDEIAEKSYSEEEIRTALNKVPRNEAQKKSSHLKIQNALFNLGVLFRDRIRNYEKSIEVLERLIREYPDYDKRDEALFYLYLSYKDLPDEARANEILSKMKKEYPSSKFTKLATDPNYANSLRENEESIGSYYDKTYALFTEGAYEEVIDRCEKKTQVFPDKKDYAAKFAIIKAMSIGKLDGKDAYIKELQQVVRAFPKTDEEARAKEILRFLKGDSEAFDEILFDEAYDRFTLDDKKLHYVFAVTYDYGQKEFDKAKKDIHNYNKSYYRFDNLKISNIYLNVESKSQIILIRSFPDRLKAMKYYTAVLEKQAEFIKDQSKAYDLYVGTQKNYREVVKQRSTKSYNIFFEKNYLNDGK